ncbi:hypothetical protein Agabi119p4_3900 [Agaricus bisporus var. burnettii]|uniref:F-box domain-containing protein n=1 Tax=Agaricus bisporus var. burnettii TaxID=192524 RepID=A0A8H7F5K3_AGABI|nr:hypothetical protein Agabi119p4_3900 [Agaricus bisporus var. burnettii]
MTGFHGLPEEISLKIVEFTITLDPLTGDRIEFNGLRSLRLVSKRFHNLASPHLFSTLRLEFKHAGDRCTSPDFMRCQEIIKALATRSTIVFHHTKKLYLCIGNLPFMDTQRLLFLDNIFDAICALENLRTVDWLFNSFYDPDELSINVIRALGKLSSFQGFKNLRFDNHPHPRLSFKPLSNLTIFRTSWGPKMPEHPLPEVAALLSRCPELIELSFDVASRHNHNLHEIFSEIGKLENAWDEIVLKGRKEGGIRFTVVHDYSKPQ